MVLGNEFQFLCTHANGTGLSFGLPRCLWVYGTVWIAPGSCHSHPPELIEPAIFLISLFRSSRSTDWFCQPAVVWMMWSNGWLFLSLLLTDPSRVVLTRKLREWLVFF